MRRLQRLASPRKMMLYLALRVYLFVCFFFVGFMHVNPTRIARLVQGIANHAGWERKLENLLGIPWMNFRKNLSYKYAFFVIFRNNPCGQNLKIYCSILRKLSFYVLARKTRNIGVQ